MSLYELGLSVLLYDMFKNSSLVVGMFSFFLLRLLVLLTFSWSSLYRCCSETLKISLTSIGAEFYALQNCSPMAIWNIKQITRSDKRCLLEE
jgi:hypothetical protein